MKRTLVLMLLFSLLIPLGIGSAQPSDALVVASQRYSLTVPEGWFISQELPLVDLQPLFPTESLTLADSEATLEAFAAQISLDDLTVPAGFSGAMVFSTVWPGGLLEMVGFDASVLGEQISIAMGTDGTSEEAVEISALTGTLYKHSDAAGELRFALLSDKTANLLMVIGISDPAHIADLESVFTGINFTPVPFQQIVDANKLPTELEILPEVLALNLPAGWWTMASEGNVMTMPTFNTDFVQGFQTHIFGDVSGIVILALPRDKADFPPEAYNEDGTLNPEIVTSLMNLGTMFGGGGEGFENIEAQTWTAQDGTVGFSMEMEMVEQGLIAYMVVIDTGDMLAALFSAASPDMWTDYRTVVETIFSTAHFVVE